MSTYFTKFKIFIFILIILCQAFATSQAKTIYEDTIDKITNVENEVSIPRNKYLKSIKDELESRKQSLVDLHFGYRTTLFCDCGEKVDTSSLLFIKRERFIYKEIV